MIAGKAKRQLSAAKGSGTLCDRALSSVGRQIVRSSKQLQTELSSQAGHESFVLFGRVTLAEESLGAVTGFIT